MTGRSRADVQLQSNGDVYRAGSALIQCEFCASCGICIPRGCEGSFSLEAGWHGPLVATFTMTCTTMEGSLKGKTGIQF